MANKKTLVIIEKRPDTSVEFWQDYMHRVGEDMPKPGDIDTTVRDPNSAEFVIDLNIQTTRDRFVKNEMAWYNIDNDNWPKNPTLQYKGHEDVHHGNADETCEDAGVCVCGPMSWAVYNMNTFVKRINYHVKDPILYYEEEHPAYLARLEYCKENNITIEVLHFDVDDNWHCDSPYFAP